MTLDLAKVAATRKLEEETSMVRVGTSMSVDTDKFTEI